jgi:hypothetical protein
LEKSPFRPLIEVLYIPHMSSTRRWLLYGAMLGALPALYLLSVGPAGWVCYQIVENAPHFVSGAFVVLVYDTYVYPAELIYGISPPHLQKVIEAYNLFFIQ